MSIDDAIAEMEAIRLQQEREERERPTRLWRDVMVMARQLNAALKLARDDGLNIGLEYDRDRVWAIWVNEMEMMGDD